MTMLNNEFRSHGSADPNSTPRPAGNLILAFLPPDESRYALRPSCNPWSCRRGTSCMNPMRRSSTFISWIRG